MIRVVITGMFSSSWPVRRFRWWCSSTGADFTGAAVSSIPATFWRRPRAWWWSHSIIASVRWVSSPPGTSIVRETTVSWTREWPSNGCAPTFTLSGETTLGSPFSVKVPVLRPSACTLCLLARKVSLDFSVFLCSIINPFPTFFINFFIILWSIFPPIFSPFFWLFFHHFVMGTEFVLNFFGFFESNCLGEFFSFSCALPPPSTLWTRLFSVFFFLGNLFVMDLWLGNTFSFRFFVIVF